jgi:hypothetical protein
MAMFVTNDPLVGAISVSIVALVAPIFAFVAVLALFILLVRFAIKAFYRAKKTTPEAE